MFFYDLPLIFSHSSFLFGGLRPSRFFEHFNLTTKADSLTQAKLSLRPTGQWISQLIQMIFCSTIFILLPTTEIFSQSFSSHFCSTAISPLVSFTIISIQLPIFQTPQQPPTDGHFTTSAPATKNRNNKKERATIFHRIISYRPFSPIEISSFNNCSLSSASSS